MIQATFALSRVIKRRDKHSDGERRRLQRKLDSSDDVRMTT
jgi:hypothetical protein